MNWWRNKYALKFIGAYEKISGRERKIIQITILSALVLIFYILAIEPLFIENRVLTDERNNLKNKNSNIERQLARALEKKYEDPNIELQSEIEKLEYKNLGLDDDIGRLTKSLVAPKEMVLLLKQVLESDKEMKLISFINLPKENVDISIAVSDQRNSENDDQAELKVDDGLIYKHSFEIEMKSTYSSTVSYLKRIDRLPWKVFWQDLKYEAETYPYGTLKIKIYTLSTSKEVLGV